MGSKYDLTNPREVRELLEKYSLAPKKGYGQNFLINRDVPYRIAASCAAGYDVGYEEGVPDKECAVLEIGPGVGSMTVCLSDLFGKVAAVEIDKGLIPLLDDTLSECDNVEVVNCDFMKTDLPSFIEEKFSGMRVKVCANLPYYITTPVLMKILESFPPTGKPSVESVTVMIQSEVADRLCADENDSEYGSVTASAALHGSVKKLFSVSPGNFYPPPKVTSSVIQITLHENGIYDVYENAPKDSEKCERFISNVKRLIELAFLKRRKTLTNALSSDFSKEEVANALESLGLRSDIRGERLSPRDFCALADKLF